MSQPRTPTDLVVHIVQHHGPILGRQVVSLCSSVGYTNETSTKAVLFNARKSGTLRKNPQGAWLLDKRGSRSA